MGESITPEQAHALIKEHGTRCILVDVRSKGEFNSLHAEPATHIPLEQISSQESLALLKNRRVLCICQRGGRGKQAMETLASCGFTEIANIEGGTLAWEAAKLPVVKGAGVISIERQVRIAAGALVLFGTLLGIGFSAALFVIPLFVGAGLIFAGVTDTCGMALLLARCPWNRR